MIRSSKIVGQKMSRAALTRIFVMLVSSLVMTACQQRSQKQINTTLPPSSKNGTPSKSNGGQYPPTDGTRPGGGGYTPSDGTSLPGSTLPGSTAPTGVNKTPNLINAGGTKDPQTSWNGDADLLPKNWRAVDLSPTGTTGTPSTTGQPNSGAQVTYKGQIKPILDRYCISCHAVGKSRDTSPLDSYPSTVYQSQLAVQVASGSMPPTGSLQMSADEKAAIAKWATAKFPN